VTKNGKRRTKKRRTYLKRLRKNGSEASTYDRGREKDGAESTAAMTPVSGKLALKMENRETLTSLTGGNGGSDKKRYRKGVERQKKKNHHIDHQSHNLRADLPEGKRSRKRNN